jgi:hypothetical protein
MNITFYPTISRGEVSKYLSWPRVLLTASSFAAKEVHMHQRVRKCLPVPKLPACIVEKAADCGGFVATFKWHGIYPYSPEQYVEWLHSWRPNWAASMDFCCEPELAQVTRQRQEQTTEMAWHFWQTYRDVPWCWVPTIQGWTVADYRWHARQMKPLIEAMWVHYGLESTWQVGIGTLCRRASMCLIREVASAVEEELGAVPLHGWGLKKKVLLDPISLLATFRSVDSAAFNGMWGAGRARGKTALKPNGSHYTQREWSVGPALERYAADIQHGLANPKQYRTLFEMEGIPWTHP